MQRGQIVRLRRTVIWIDGVTEEGAIGIVDGPRYPESMYVVLFPFFAGECQRKCLYERDIEVVGHVREVDDGQAG